MLFVFSLAYGVLALTLRVCASYNSLGPSQIKGILLYSSSVMDAHCTT